MSIDTGTFSEKRDRDNASLRYALDNIQNDTKEWWEIVALLAKGINMGYLELQKIIARVFQRKNIQLDGFHEKLKNAWHNCDLELAA